MQQYLIKGIPLTWKAPFVGTRGAYSPRTPIKEQIKRELTNQNFCPLLAEPIGLILVFYLPIPKSASKKKKVQMQSGQIRPTNGDVSNFRKFMEDCLQETVITNDNLVMDSREAKYYDIEPRTVIQVYLIDEFEKKFGILKQLLPLQ